MVARDVVVYNSVPIPVRFRALPQLWLLFLSSSVVPETQKEGGGVHERNVGGLRRMTGIFFESTRRPNFGKTRTRSNCLAGQ